MTHDALLRSLEEWRPIAGWGELYEVSSLGRVRSLPRTWFNGMGKRQHRGQLMKVLGKTTSGYPMVTLYQDGRPTYRLMHLVVLEAFVGPKPFDTAQCNHKNGDRSDNRVENLEWVTASQNRLHSHRVLRKNVGEQHRFSKLTADNVRDAINRRRRGETYASIARRFGVGYGAISDAVNGKTWKTLERTNA